jgi:hypothetical protein
VFFSAFFSHDPVSCFALGTLNLFLYAFKPFRYIFLSCAFLTWNPGFLPFAFIHAEQQLGPDGLLDAVQPLGGARYLVFCRRDGVGAVAERPE